MTKELELITILTDNNKHRVSDVASQLHLTNRAVYYYIKRLERKGFKFIKEGTFYRLDRQHNFFKKLQNNIALNQNEALYIYNTLDTAEPNDVMAQNIKTKIERYFNLDTKTIMADAKRVHNNTIELKKAIAQQKVVYLKNYESPHSNTIKDRIVEPFKLYNNGCDVRCLEIGTKLNKTFKVARAESVEIVDVDWFNEALHKPLFTDIFMFSGDQKHNIVLQLDLLAYNLIKEEFPLSEEYIKQTAPNVWTLSACITSFVAPARFIIGLFEHIKIVENKELKAFVKQQINAIYGSLNKTN